LKLPPLPTVRFRTTILLGILALASMGTYFIFINHGYLHITRYDKGTLYYSLLRSGECKLKIDGEINDSLINAFDEVIKKAEHSSCDSYEVELNSLGGNLAVALDIGNIIKMKKMTTIALNRCKSSCMYLFISGETRIASKHTIFGMHQSRNIRSEKCATPNDVPKDNPNFFISLQEYAIKRLGEKAGKFFTAKDNVASCNEMLQIDNEEFLREGIINQLTED
jgi:membrane-bound ClpP family serine protease